MSTDPNFDRFVAVGGLGGSGTRVVAQILDKMGFYLGPVLNPQMDSILFTLLFKRSDWITTFPSDQDIDRIAEIFQIAMRSGVRSAFKNLDQDEAKQLFQKTRSYGVTRDWFDQIMASPPPKQKRFSGVAWKEPNTHVFLPQLLKRFPELKYIHVIRNGLDMALSGNKQQLTNWGARFGISPNQDASSPNVQLQFWLAANKRVVEIGKTMPPGQFYLLNYDALCADFSSELPLIEAFLDRKLSAEDKSRFAEYIGSSSIGRFRSAPTGTFTEQERDAVRQFGFDVE
ncbi:MAG: sulfotransferase [Pelagimonas sp.]|uniref:sulfotransferase n=1 Tax=Pelagimonas sp. TaxID=2073170 RepID=UPI003D6B7E1B